MKRILSILLGITLATYSSVALADDTTTVYVSMASDTTAKVCTATPLGYDSSKSLGTVPVTFADGTTWSDVKRSYDVSSAEATALGTKGACLTVHGDGGISVSTMKCSMMKESSKK